jgi:hypothetical protein
LVKAVGLKYDLLLDLRRSTDLVSFGFYLFSNLKKIFDTKRFSSDTEFKAAVNGCLKNQVFWMNQPH